MNQRIKEPVSTIHMATLQSLFLYDSLEVCP